MIVCVCKNLNSRQLNDYIQRGMSIDDIIEEAGLGTGCGACLEYACNMVKDGVKQSSAAA